MLKVLFYHGVLPTVRSQQKYCCWFPQVFDQIEMEYKKTWGLVLLGAFLLKKLGNPASCRGGRQPYFSFLHLLFIGCILADVFPC